MKRSVSAQRRSSTVATALACGVAAALLSFEPAHAEPAPAPATSPAPAPATSPAPAPAPDPAPAPETYPAPEAYPAPETSSSPTPPPADDGVTAADRKKAASARKAKKKHDRFLRDGFVTEFELGVSVCVQGVASCSNDGAEAGTLVGGNGPHLAAGMTLGYRIMPYILLGASYSANLLSPRWGLGAAPESDEAQLYRRAHMHGVFGVMRLLIPVSRVDIGLEAAPGFGWQFFNAQENRLVRTLPDTGTTITVQRESSSGFSLKLAPMVNVYVNRRIYLGLRGDLILAFHGSTCYKDAATLQDICVSKSYSDVDRRAPVSTLGIKALVGFIF